MKRATTIVASAEPEQPGVRDPQQRMMPEQDVPYRAAAERGDAAEQCHAHPVHAAPAGGQRRRHGLRHEAHDRQHMKHRIAMLHDPSPVSAAMAYRL